MKVSMLALLAVALVGCEGEPMAPTPEEMFEYDSKPVGDPGAETYRDEAGAVEAAAGRDRDAPSDERR